MDLLGYFGNNKNNKNDSDDEYLIDSFIFMETTELDFDDFDSDENNIEMIIAKERDDSLYEIEKDMEGIKEIWKSLSVMVDEQGEEIDEGAKNIDDGVKNTEIATENLEEANNIVVNSLTKIRDVAIVVSGGLLGTIGFLLGPIVGIGTVAAGISAGGATVYGIHKIN